MKRRINSRLLVVGDITVTTTPQLGTCRSCRRALAIYLDAGGVLHMDHEIPVCPDYLAQVKKAGGRERGIVEHDKTKLPRVQAKR